MHRPIAIKCGVAPAKLDALPAWRESACSMPGSARRWLTSSRPARSGEVDDATFAARKKFFSPQEIVELDRAGGLVCRQCAFVRALRIATETEQTR